MYLSLHQVTLAFLSQNYEEVFFVCFKSCLFKFKLQILSEGSYLKIMYALCGNVGIFLLLQTQTKHLRRLFKRVLA